MKLTTLALATLVAALATPDLARCQEASEAAMREVVLSGDAHERGLIHGRTLRAEIVEMVELWRRDIERSYGRDADRFVQEFLAATDYRSAIERWTPELLEEVHGIAQGAGIDFETMFAYQLIDEHWAVGRRLLAHHCTSIGIPAVDGRPTLLAQNLDIPRWMHAHPTMLHLMPHEGSPETFVLTLPGLIGANGMNAASIGVTVNTLLQLRPSIEGLPVAFVVRGILARSEHAQAVDFVRSIEHASGQNYIVGGPQAAPGLECSATRVERFLPYEDSKLTYHTNHPLVNTDWNPDYLALLERAGRSVEQGLGHCNRFDSLETRLRAELPVDEELIVSTLGSRDVAGDTIANPSTYLCTLFVLDPLEPELHVSAGPADVTVFETFRFAAQEALAR